MIEIPVVKTWDFTNLPAGMKQSDVLPESITVHLKDGNHSSVYTLTVVVERQGNKLTVKSADYVRNGDSTVYDKALFVNTYKEPDEPVPSKETVTISGEKSWNHGSNTNPPETVTLYILADGQRKISFTVDESSHWRYSFALPKYNTAGKEIVYTVDEEPIQDYRKSINGFNITNTHISVPDPNDPNQGGTSGAGGTNGASGAGNTTKENTF